MSHPGTEESLVWSSVVRSGTDRTEKKKVQVTRVMILSAVGKWCAGLLWICPFRSHPIIHAWVVDQDPRGYVQRDALEEMRSLEQIVWSKWSKPCRSNSFASAFDLLFLSTGAQFLWWEMTSLIYILVVFERLRHRGRAPHQRSQAQKKAPTHMSVLRYSQVWWARSHHPQSCPASKQQAQRRGMAGRKEEQVRFIFSYTQWRASGKMIDKEKNKKKNLSPTFYITQKQCAPQPVDPPVHPKVSKFGGRVKKSLCLHAKHYVLP